MNWKDVPMTGLIARLPRDARGFPVPAFVYRPEGWKSGQPLDMRVVDVETLIRGAQEHRCGVCGGTLYSKVWFIGGPMCLVNRIFESPVHHDCALFSLAVCPHLSRSGAHYSTRPSEETVKDPNLVRVRPPYQVLVATRGYAIVLRDPETGLRLPKPLCRIEPWLSCEFRNDDGTPTSDRYAVISNPLGTALYCFDCIGHGKPAITFDPAQVERRSCPTCGRQLAEPIAIEVPA